MNRRRFAILLASAPLALRAVEQSVSLRGKLEPGPPAAIRLPARSVVLSGDTDTMGVLNDTRLNGTDFETIGHYTAPDHFEVDKIHTRSLFVHQAGKRLMVTYWCDVCYIQTYAPGKCWCCQKDTELDLRENLPAE